MLSRCLLVFKLFLLLLFCCCWCSCCCWHSWVCWHSRCYIAFLLLLAFLLFLASLLLLTFIVLYSCCCMLPDVPGEELWRHLKDVYNQPFRLLCGHQRYLLHLRSCFLADFAPTPSLLSPPPPWQQVVSFPVFVCIARRASWRKKGWRGDKSNDDEKAWSSILQYNPLITLWYTLNIGPSTISDVRPL